MESQWIELILRCVRCSQELRSVLGETSINKILELKENKEKLTDIHCRFLCSFLEVCEEIFFKNLVIVTLATVKYATLAGKIRPKMSVRKNMSLQNPQMSFGIFSPQSQSVTSVPKLNPQDLSASIDSQNSSKNFSPQISIHKFCLQMPVRKFCPQISIRKLSPQTFVRKL